jgi:hypothetical protein
MMSAPSFSSGIRKVGFSLSFFFLPLKSVRPFIFFDPHLIHGGGMAVGGILDVKRGYAKQMAYSSNRQHQVSDVDSERAIHGTALTGIAFGGGNLRCSLDELGADLALLFYHLPHCLFYFSHR